MNYPVDKIPLRHGSRALVLNAPAGYLEAWQAAAQGVELLRQPPTGGASCDVVKAFVRSEAELRALLPVALGVLKPGGQFWIAYPRRPDNEMHRDTAWDAVFKEGLRVVTVVVLDAEWQAVRFRPLGKGRARAR
ncbi:MULTISPECIES: hypothetical protein [unclassified Meiothermus]|uniref:hypothetical protein n=1 Tax=unclassified Meiothermus TaxID=370471 RepID=UPI000D7C3390|nr:MULTISPECIES: hypothetical protein [unclassified Meiothermus]PZA06858.1 hypothetical protein DNA98_11665 [Meiothermus sp. Pnk-1]RYM33180.1 hypothetical protein EWH23_13610 [Meiothermus sp. PNK-Is4]